MSSKHLTQTVGAPSQKVKEPKKLYALIIALATVLAMWVPTQFFAWKFRYQEVLGPNIGHVYPPWNILVWKGQWGQQYPKEIKSALTTGIMPFALAVLGILGLKMRNNKAMEISKRLHGSARWATRDDIEKAGLILVNAKDRLIMPGKKPKEWKPSTEAQKVEKVFVGAWKDEKGQMYYLAHGGPEHILTFAPTRSGKGVGLVIPTLLTWTESCVVADLKGELWALTAGWRSKSWEDGGANNRCIRFEPAVRGSARWNPLDEIRLGAEEEIGDAQNLATLIVDPDGKGLNDHWQKTAFTLITGLILHVLYKAHNHERDYQRDQARLAKNDDPKRKKAIERLAKFGVPKRAMVLKPKVPRKIVASLPSVDAMLADPNSDVATLWADMKNYNHTDTGPHPVVAQAGQDMLDRAAEEAGSVLSTVKSYFGLYRDKTVAANVEVSDFRIRDLMNKDQAISLYIVSQPNDKARLRPLIRVCVNMIIRLLADKMDFDKGRPKAHYKHRLLMMLDEFPSLGRLDIVQESLAFVAGYGIKCYLITQDLSQLKSSESGYGQEESITSNCHLQNAYPPNRIETAEHLSRLTGQMTVVKKQENYNGGGMFAKKSWSIQEVQRPLLTPDECLRMAGPKKSSTGDIIESGDMVVYCAGFPAIYGKQILYFKDTEFLAKAMIPAPQETGKKS